MHIGGLRTALYSYLLAKRTGGQFLLRIEDTDQQRLVVDAEDRLCEDLRWAGVQWDEGPQIGGPCGPYKQSERTQIYQDHAEMLVKGESAYRCFCTPQTAGVGSAASVTSGCYQGCSSLSTDESQDRAGKQPYTVRLKHPHDVHERKYPDLIYGNIKRLKRTPTASQARDEESALDAAETVLLKSDGTPTYHLANVVDDHLMNITHVIRGTEWMASTPLHYDLYYAFGWEPPAFAHVGLLLDENNAKLSKRNADLALDVQALRDDHGVLPETLCNFLALQGWSNPNKSDIMDMAELVRSFDLKFTTGNTMVRMEKMWFLQKHHVQRRCEIARRTNDTKPIADIVERIQAEAVSRYPELKDHFETDIKLSQYCTNLLVADDKSYYNAQQFVDRHWYFFTFDLAGVPKPPEYYDRDQSVSYEAVRKLCSDLLKDFDSTRPYQEPLFPKPAEVASKLKYDLERPPTEIEQVSAKLLATIRYKIWQTLVCKEWDPVATPPHQKQAGQIPFTDLPFDAAAYANHFARETSFDAEQLLGYYMAWHRAVMRRLRDGLGCGISGPSIGTLMAVLGRRECCRRLGVEGVEVSGW